MIVHHGVDDFFVLGKSAGLAQQLVHHGGLTVVNVRDDRNVADLFAHNVSKMPLLVDAAFLPKFVEFLAD